MLSQPRAQGIPEPVLLLAPDEVLDQGGERCEEHGSGCLNKTKRALFKGDAKQPGKHARGHLKGTRHKKRKQKESAEQ